MWSDIPMDAVKEEWQGGLYGFTLTEIGNAINHCAENNKFPPTLPEFRDLCNNLKHSIKTANQPFTHALPRKYTREELDANQKKLQSAVSVLTHTNDYRGWARKILANPGAHKDIAVKYAQEALKAPMVTQ